MAVVRVRDMQTRQCRDFGDETPVMRVPWDLSNVTGPCRLENGLVHYTDRTGEHVARAQPDRLGACRPGAMVLVQYAETRDAHPDVWWLCEVEAINGRVSTTGV